MVPVGIVGVFFQDEIESLFTGNILLVGTMLLITGVLLMFTHFKNDGKKEVTPLIAMMIGLAQAIAVLPGISRSGSTIATALLLGVEKSKATQFSFLMVLVPIFGASFLKFKDYLEAPEIGGNTSVSVLMVGFFAAFISGYIACSWMIRIVKKGKLTYFAAYCFVIGLMAIAFHYAA
jgi:undecaprenyl-diphosphatase